jgi:hypothetical protein
VSGGTENEASNVGAVAAGGRLRNIASGARSSVFEATARYNTLSKRCRFQKEFHDHDHQ